MLSAFLDHTCSAKTWTPVGAVSVFHQAMQVMMMMMMVMMMMMMQQTMHALGCRLAASHRYTQLQQPCSFEDGHLKGKMLLCARGTMCICALATNCMCIYIYIYICVCKGIIYIYGCVCIMHMLVCIYIYIYIYTYVTYFCM